MSPLYFCNTCINFNSTVTCCFLMFRKQRCYHQLYSNCYRVADAADGKEAI